MQWQEVAGLAAAVCWASGSFIYSRLDAPAAAQMGGEVPGNWSGSASDAELWRAIRKGVQGTVNIPDTVGYATPVEWARSNRHTGIRHLVVEFTP